MKAIITFHSIDDSGSVLSFPQQALDSLLQGIRDAGLPILDLPTLLQAETRHGIALTFDDGMRSLYTHGLPVLRRHNAPAHLYLATASVGRSNRWPGQPEAAPDFDMLNWDEIEALHGAGIRIESHTHNHPDMRALDADAMEQECEQADALIEQRLGRRPRYFAYPYGYRNATACKVARRRYAGSVTTQLAVLRGGEDPAELPRLDSYYLQAPWLQRRLDSLAARAYFRLRSLLRSVRGTQ